MAKLTGGRSVGDGVDGQAPDPCRGGRRLAAIGLGGISILWLGMLLGVSFLATPVKFLAPSLTLPVALDVGRQTFATFNWVEIGLWTMLLASALAGRTRWRVVTVVAGIGAVLALQTLWLLPTLDARVEAILRGGMPPPSSLHLVYILLDVLKLVFLGVIAFAGVRRMAAP